MTKRERALNESIARISLLIPGGCIDDEFWDHYADGNIACIMRIKGKTYIDVVELDADTQGLWKTLHSRLSE